MWMLRWPQNTHWCHQRLLYGVMSYLIHTAYGRPLQHHPCISRGFSWRKRIGNRQGAHFYHHRCASTKTLHAMPKTPNHWGAANQEHPPPASISHTVFIHRTIIEPGWRDLIINFQSILATGDAIHQCKRHTLHSANSQQEDCGEKWWQRGDNPCVLWPWYKYCWTTWVSWYSRTMMPFWEWGEIFVLGCRGMENLHH